MPLAKSASRGSPLYYDILEYTYTLYFLILYNQWQRLDVSCGQSTYVANAIKIKIIKCSL